MLWTKIRKKHLQFHQTLRKKLIHLQFHQEVRNHFQSKKKSARPYKQFNKLSEASTPVNQDVRKKNFARKFIEQQTTKDFIKKDNKPIGKSKLKLKGPIDKRDFKLTVSRALNVEEIEIKQRSLASVKRARLKEKKKPDGEEKKEFKKVI